jgi:hypothetical protein
VSMAASTPCGARKGAISVPWRLEMGARRGSLCIIPSLAATLRFVPPGASAEPMTKRIGRPDRASRGSCSSPDGRSGA